MQFSSYTFGIGRMGIAFLISLFVASGGLAQQTGDGSFDLESYKQFLESNQHLTYEGLLQMQEQGQYNTEVAPPSFSDAKFADSVLKYYPLNDTERNKLNQHNFMVTDRIRYESFGKAYRTIFKRDLPVYLSSDAVLHALHMGYSDILSTIEEQSLSPAIENVLSGMHQQLSVLDSRYGDQPGMTRPLRNVDLYLTVPLRLMGQNVSPYYKQNQSRVDTLMDMVRGESLVDYPLFSDVPRRIDFSQFKPRGHYTQSDKLKRYFRTMMWLGRTEIYMVPPESKRYNGLADSTRFEIGQQQSTMAFLMHDALTSSGQDSTLSEVNRLLKFFVGNSDNIGFSDLGQLKSTLSLDNSAALQDSATYASLKQQINQNDMGQRILSQVLMHDPMNPGSVEPSKSFMVMGQRFVIDSYIMGKVVYDRIDAKRMLPKGADVLYSLGNNQALDVLEDELKKYNYATELAALRHLVDQYGSGFWKETLFNMWLQGIRALNPPAPNRVDSLPSFMQTEGWTRKTMNTQLASWAQLRHDNLLYAKQSYSAGWICHYPKVLVEPVPQFFEAMQTLGNQASDRIANLSVIDGNMRDRINEYYSRFAEINGKLAEAARTMISGETYTDEESKWLKDLAFEGNMCGVELSGWYKDLYWSGDDGAMEADMTIADVHTAPTDEMGNMVGYVMHAGTGPLNLAVVSTEMPDGNTYAFVGPVMSYYTHTTTGFERLSDEEWKETVFKQDATTRPVWADRYMSETGEPYYDHIGIGVNVPEEKAAEQPDKLRLHDNYPNPFNPSTLINFEIPQRLEGEQVRLTIHTLNGRKVSTLIDRAMSAGSYSVRWNAKQQASGVYIYQLEVGGLKKTRKMTLLK